MNNTTRRASILTAALLLASAAGCTDTLVTPKSTISEGTVFKDPASYTAFIAKIYAGLALTGQRGGAGEPDIDPAVFSDEGFSNYVRLLWNLNELPTDESAVAWGGDLSIQELNTALWAAKEAVFRALGTPWKRGMNWTDVEVVCDNGSPPHVIVSGATRELMTARGVNHVMLTMAFCRTFATATAIAVRSSGVQIAEDTALDD